MELLFRGQSLCLCFILTLVFIRSNTFVMVLCPVSEVFTGLPPHSSPHRHGKGEGWGIKGQSSTEGPWGLYALPRPGGEQPPSCSAPQLTCRILPPGRGPMGHGCCQNLLPPQLEEQRERKLITCLLTSRNLLSPFALHKTEDFVVCPYHQIINE